MPELGLVAPLHNQGATVGTVPLLLDVGMTALTHARSIMMTAAAFERLQAGTMKYAAIVCEKRAAAVCMEIGGEVLLCALECG